MFSIAWTRCGGLFFYCQDHFCGWYTLTELLTARFFALYPVLVLRIPESIDLGLTKDFYLVLTAATLSIGINIDLLGLLNRHFSNFFDHFVPFFFTNFEKNRKEGAISSDFEQILAIIGQNY